MADDHGREDKRYVAPNIGVVIDGATYENVNISASGVLIKGDALKASEGEIVKFQLIYPMRTKLVDLNLEGRVVRADGETWALKIETSTIAWQRLLDLHVTE
jgi:hypothetical protein